MVTVVFIVGKTIAVVFKMVLVSVMAIVMVIDDSFMRHEKT